VPSVSLYVRRKDDSYQKCGPKTVYVLGTTFVLRYETEGRRRWEKLPSGIDYAAAKRLALEKELALYRSENPEKRQESVQPLQPKPKAPEPGTLALDQAIDRYLAVAKTKSARTYSGYIYTMKQFYACVGNLALGEISKQHLYDFLAAMKKAGLGDRTCHNRCAEISTMLRFHGVNVSIRVKYTEKIVRAYRDDELQKLFSVADPEEHLLFSFFLATGAREQEIQYATWSDVDLEDGIFTVRDHPEYGFVPKDREMREIPLPAELVKRLKARERTSNLIFPKNGKPNGHMLRTLKAIAKRAGIDPRVCGLHVFRKTFATRLHRAGVDARSIQRLLGHGDLATTLAYLEAENARSERMRSVVNATFKAFDAVSVREGSRAVAGCPASRFDA
jgi:integrase/recombinase XerD